MIDQIRRLFHHSGVYLLGNLLNRAGAFVLLPLYTHQLSVAEYGALEVLYSTVAIVSVVLSAGLAHTTLRFYFDFESVPERNAVVTTNLWTVAAAGTLGATVIYFCRTPLSELLFDSAQYSEAIAYCLLILVVEMATEIGLAYLRAQEKSVLFIWISFARLISQLGLSIYFVAYLQLGVVGILKANLASVSLCGLVVVAYTVRNCGWAIRVSFIAPMLRYSIPFALGGIVGAITLNVDRFLLKESLSLEAVGIYALALKFALILTLLVSEPFARAYGPFRFSILNRPDANEIQAAALKYIVMASTICATAIGIFVPDVVRHVIGSNYEDVYRYCPVLLVSAVIASANYCFETGILYKKKTHYLLYVSLLVLAAKIALNLALLPTMGIQGAAAAHLGASVIQALATNSTSQRLFPVVYSYFPMIRCALIAIPVWAIAAFFDTQSWYISVPLKILLVAIHFGIVLWHEAELRTFLTSRIIGAFTKHAD